jgi:hypothetical protein
VLGTYSVFGHRTVLNPDLYASLTFVLFASLSARAGWPRYTRASARPSLPKAVE